MPFKGRRKPAAKERAANRKPTTRRTAKPKTKRAGHTASACIVRRSVNGYKYLITNARGDEVARSKTFSTKSAATKSAMSVSKTRQKVVSHGDKS